MPMGHTATAQAGSGGLTATEHRLANGLRVVLSEDHLTPVAAVCLWYDVGSRHEVKGRTGLAHLFEHLMFQGSGQVKGNGHFELVQGAGGSLNGTTSFERTNYFETMPTHQGGLALWLEADRMGSLLAALDEESMENQRDVVKNERRQRYDNVPYGTAFEKLSGGQQARFQILLLELAGTTALLLDEPTDNLDLESAEALQDGLEVYDGTVMAVTHDRWFAKSFDRYLVFGSDGVVRETTEPVWDERRVDRVR